MKTITVLLSLALLAGCAGNGLQQNNQVRIVRDNYGVPHIYAADIYGLYYGYGYAVAQDRLFQMEMARRSTQGTVAEVLGADYIEFDKNTRTLFNPASIKAQLKSLNARDSDVFEGYAAGMNAWLAEVRKSPADNMPAQFIEFDFEPMDWSAYDVAMIFIGTMNNRYGDFNTELANATILAALIGQHGEQSGMALFDMLNPRFTDNAPTTVPRQNWSREAYDSLAPAVVPDVTLLPRTEMAASASVSGFSNCYVLGKDKLAGGGSVLINGPQFGWYNPSYVYSVGMHGAGIDVVGNTPFAYPMIMFGHNSTISWGSTWGASDIVDIYQEKLNPENSNQYYYNGEYREFDRRTETIAVKGAADVTLEVLRSVHGPVIHTNTEDGVAFAKMRAWEGGELDTLLAWLYATWAADYKTWKAEAEKSAINVNMYFADVDGNIGYFHGGQFPTRVAGHDNRLPVTGDGSMDWQGRQSIDSANPHVLNPVRGYLANWNNKPGHGVMNPDHFFYSWNAVDRVDVLHEALSARQEFTAGQAWDILEMSSYADINAAYFLPLIDDAITESSTEALQRANNLLQDWSRESRDADQDGYYDEAGTAIFRTFVGELIEQVLADDLGSAYAYFQSSGYPSSAAPTAAGTNTPTGLKAVYEALHGRGEYDLLNGESRQQIIRRSLQNALNKLPEQRLAVASRPFKPVNFLGIPQAAAGEGLTAPIEQNRGTENNMIIMQPNAIVAYEVVSPGQSGFISAAGEKSKHYDDQFEMYYQFEKKRSWFYARDVEANKQSETLLSYQ